MKSFNKILDLCEKHGFLKQVVNASKKLIQIGPVGALLQENLHNEWFNNVVINKDITVFMDTTNGDLKETLNYAKTICLNCAPFGIAETLQTNRKRNVSDKQNENVDFCSFFEQSTELRCAIFVTPSESMHFLHQWSRQRRMWWRKFSASPGRYLLTDIKNVRNHQCVEIRAKYSWGQQLIETLTLHTCNYLHFNKDQLQITDGKKSVAAHVVVSDVCDSTMLLNTLCDAYEEPLFQNEPRPLLYLHRKLAPYKISFAITSSSQKSVVAELRDLAIYLCRQLRNNHVSCLFVPLSYTYTLEAQWKQYDQMGIPYNVLLNENTLKNGVALLRNRDTTLKEQVHVTQLANYVDQLFKNY